MSPIRPLAALLALLAPALHADEVQVAVAANFTAPARQIAAGFERATGHRALLSFGATGSFYAQIRSGAPFEVLLAADAATPARLEAEGAGSGRFCYAIGRLVLWSPKAGVVDPRGEVLRRGGFRHLAVGNPKLAPYGAAAMEVLAAMGLATALMDRLVLGENIAQAHQFVATGNAELGFVALAQVTREGRIPEGSAWVVPEAMHAPIRQEAVLLARGKDRPAARAWLAFLQGGQARAVIQAYGYGLPAAR